TLLCTVCAPNVHQRAFFEGSRRDAKACYFTSCVTTRWSESGEDGIRTRGRGMSPFTGLANRRYRPLSHLSIESYLPCPQAFTSILPDRFCWASLLLYYRVYYRAEKLPPAAIIRRRRRHLTLSEEVAPCRLILLESPALVKHPTGQRSRTRNFLSR